ncbi:hypothetical protein CDAR_300461 [Caerostris darwini]|uniref:Uncharacterized protein n=1 Tax=Caerostris darwini TaxID=1538125 RepID=A0AAV4MTN1_9ARAC|nr:hypothetical protein CDAR_300461 [Caerostris darwini]
MVGPEQSHSVEYESSDYNNIHTVCGTQFSSPTVVEQWLELPLAVAWPSRLRRWFKAPVSSEAWVRIPPLPGKKIFRTVAALFFIVP